MGASECFFALFYGPFSKIRFRVKCSEIDSSPEP